MTAFVTLTVIYVLLDSKIGFTSIQDIPGSIYLDFWGVGG